MEIRINKFLADQGIASRRGSDQLILEKRISVNGVILEKPGHVICDTDRVALDGKEIVRKSKQGVFILLNKPANCVTTAKDTHGRKTVLDCVQSESRIFPIGRLDIHTTGVLILTNDGDLANALMHPRYSIEKEYRAYLDRALTDKDMNKLESGIMLDGVKTSRSRIRFLGKDRREVIVTLHEGKNRQIHRMFGTLGYSVEKLERIRYAGLESGDLKRGEWRHLTEEEIESLKHFGTIQHP
ncbi:MAG: pseudouridine synthase [Patescibacteria group bacterium]